jgi:hypothetical protein
MAIQLEKLVGIILGLIAVILIIGIILYISPLKQGISSSIDSIFAKDKVPNTIQKQANYPFFDEFIKSYNECKLSLGENCYCEMAFSGVPEGYIVELESKERSNTINSIKIPDGNYITARLHVGSKLTEVEDQLVNSTIIKEPLTITKELGKGKLYFSNVLLSLSRENSQLNKNEFIEMPLQYLENNLLRSSKDLWNFKGTDSKLDNGLAMYKFDKGSIAFLPIGIGATEVSNSLKSCSKVPKALEAKKQFDAFIEAVECSRIQSKCSLTPTKIQGFEINIKSVPTDSKVLGIPSITLESNGKILDTKQFLIEDFCQFTDFKKTSSSDAIILATPDLSESKTLDISNYKFIEIYSLPNKFCILPYDESLVREKIIAEGKTGLVFK